MTKYIDRDLKSGVNPAKPPLGTRERVKYEDQYGTPQSYDMAMDAYRAGKRIQQERRPPLISAADIYLVFAGVCVGAIVASMLGVAP